MIILWHFTYCSLDAVNGALLGVNPHLDAVIFQLVLWDFLHLTFFKRPPVDIIDKSTLKRY